MRDREGEAKLSSNFLIPIEGGPQLPELKPSLKIEGGIPDNTPAAPAQPEKTK
jgi:hypothetical protein